MHLDRAFRDVKDGSHLLVGEALGYLAHDLHLASGQALQLLLQVIQLVDVLEVGAQRLAQDLLAGHDIGQLGEQHVGLGVLEQVAIGTGLEQGHHVLAGIGDGQDHHAGGDLFGPQRLEGI